MDVREKLVELIRNVRSRSSVWDTTGDIADYLIAHGVTVWDGEPIGAFLHPIDAYKGLKAKYLVFKADTGEMVNNCFILRPDKDAVAVEALRAYAKVTDNETLAKDIYNWVGSGVTVQEWISVKDRLPPPNELVLCWWQSGDGEKEHYGFATFQSHGVWHVSNEGMQEVTHWMPLPQPPKGE